MFAYVMHPTVAIYKHNLSVVIFLLNYAGIIIVPLKMIDLFTSYVIASSNPMNI